MLIRIKARTERAQETTQTGDKGTDASNKIQTTNKYCD